MAKLFEVYKIFRPRRTILSEDFNALQQALEAAFDLLGTRPPNGETGVSTTWHCANPIEPQHAVTKNYLESVASPAFDPFIEKARQWAELEPNQDVNGVPGDRSARHWAAEAAASASATSSIRFEDAAPLAYFLGQS